VTQVDELVRTEVIANEPAEALAAMLDIEQPTAAGGTGTVPPLWHWLYLLDRRRQRDLGPDGHPTSGIPAPPGPGRRRMFAGGRVRTLRPLVIGRPATRTARVAQTLEKQGRTGPLTFVTVRHVITQDGEPAVMEEQDIVYRAPGSATLPADPADEPAPPPGPSLSLAVDEVMLFRFSALTYNAHRIHYDHGWVREEGYADLVVHGPLQALMMAELMRREGVDLVGRQYAYRLVSPMIGPQVLTVHAAPQGLSMGAETRDAQGQVTVGSTLTALDPQS
jgi:3-methylfumaryl-CoA hydratase